MTENQIYWHESWTANEKVIGECPAGQAGTPTRTCDGSFNWGLVTGSCSSYGMCMTFRIF